MMQRRFDAGRKALGRFFSRGRLCRNICVHFLVPYAICTTLWLFTALAWEPLFETALPDRQMLHHMLRRIAFALVMALHFSTAASCLRRRFCLPLWGVIAAACAGLALGAWTGDTYAKAEAALTLVSLLVCVVITCWTRNPLLSLIKVTLWFTLCFLAVFVLTIAGLLALSGIYTALYPNYLLPRLYLMGMAYQLAPLLFLGGLPFGDENFMT